eukprot:SAG11_NODE_716_length_7614_cov_63.924837_14_plen_198_part_00
MIPRWYTYASKKRGIAYGRAQRLRAVQQISAAVCDSSVSYETPRNHIRTCAASRGGAADIRGRMRFLDGIRNTEESHTAVRSVSGRCSICPRPYVIPRWYTYASKHRGITYGLAQNLRAVQQISTVVCDSSVVYVRIETPRNHIRPCAASQGGAASRFYCPLSPPESSASLSSRFFSLSLLSILLPLYQPLSPLYLA